MIWGSERGAPGVVSFFLRRRCSAGALGQRLDLLVDRPAFQGWGSLRFFPLLGVPSRFLVAAPEWFVLFCFCFLRAAPAA